MRRSIRFTNSSAVIVLLLVFLLHSVTGYCEKRHSSLSIQPNDSKISRLYTAMLDRDVEIALSVLDSSGFLPAEWPKNASGILVNPLPMQLDKTNTLRTAELACALAHSYCIPQSKGYKQPVILSCIQRIIQSFMDDPLFKESNSSRSNSTDPVQMALHFHPLLAAYALTNEFIPKNEQKKVRDWFTNRIGLFYQNPIRSQNSSGMKWCSLMALASQATGDPKYQNATADSMDWLIPLIHDSGEYMDPAGFDLHRATSFIHDLFFYRIYSGQENLDVHIVRLLNWYTRLVSFRGVPLLGIQEPLGKQYLAYLSQLLGPLTFYASMDPTFLQTATRYMETLMDLPAGFALENGGNSFLMASAYHHIPDALLDIPFPPYINLYNNSSQSTYLLAGRNYQTAVVLNDPSIPKGLQAWSYKGEPPLVFPSPPRYSHTVGFGYDSRRINARQEKKPFSHKIVHVTDCIDILFAPTNGPSSTYIFSKDMTVVIHQQPFEDALVEWILDGTVCASPRHISGNTVQFDGSSANLILPMDLVPNFEEFDAGYRMRLHFKSTFCWYTFAGPESKSIIRPLHSNLLFIHLHEPDLSLNLIVNNSPNVFAMQQNFPGTTIPIPEMTPWSVKIVHTQ